VNKAFCTRNLDLIWKFRYFIIVLYKKLQELSKQQQEKNYMTVYQGQNMRKNELEMLKKNIGSLISTDTIMSTTRNPIVALFFLEEEAEIHVIISRNQLNII
jgi:hypothetical protein